MEIWENKMKKLQMYFSCFLFGYWIPIIFRNPISVSIAEARFTFVILVFICVLSVVMNFPKKQINFILFD
jgi:hypothetical protein